jgi:hypothetical protein
LPVGFDHGLPQLLSLSTGFHDHILNDCVIILHGMVRKKAKKNIIKSINSRINPFQRINDVSN